MNKHRNKTILRKQRNVILAVTNDLVTDQRVNKVATSLTELGYNVCIVGRYVHNSINLPDKPYAQKRFRLCFTKGMLFYAEYNFRLFFYLMFKQVDIITANDLDTLLACFLIARIRGKKIVYDSHEYFTEVPELLHNNFAKKVWTKLESYIFPKLKHVSTVCKSIADIYAEKYSVKIHVIRNVPQLQTYTHQKIKSSQFEGKYLIIYQGAVNIGRGIELMIETMQYIDDAVFLIIGGGDKEQEFRQYVAKQGLQQKVQFTGKLHYSKLREYTLQADLGISLEENMGLNYYYALPNKLFDYIQASTPIIASDLPEIKRIIDHYKVGVIAQSRNPKELAKQIIELRSNTQLIEDITRNQKKAATELCWEHEVKILQHLYSN